MEVCILEGYDIGELDQQMNIVLKNYSEEDIFDIKITAFSNAKTPTLVATIIFKGGPNNKRSENENQDQRK